MFYFGRIAPFSAKNLQVGVACFLLCLLQSQAHQQNLKPEVCQSLNVGHRSSIIIDPSTVAIELVDSSGDRKDCFEPQKIYNISVRSFGKPIYGLLMLQDADKVYDGELPLENARLPSGLKGGFCGHSVSHRCIFRTSHQRATNCNLTNEVMFPYKAPSDRNKVVELRYSIVFTYAEFLENKRVEFQACPQLPTPTDSSNLACNVSDFEIKDSTSPLKILCKDNPRWKSKEAQSIVENGTRYTCEVDGTPVRKKMCSSGCQHDGDLLCCRVKNTTHRMRTFTCIPDDISGPSIKREFLVTSQRKCECFLCSDVCPVKESSGDLLTIITTEAENETEDPSVNLNETEDPSVNLNSVE